ncbi:response regulator [Shewanella maritima]|uniref:Response regulator n=2 Tax=Shewanella maritima TaxID=2520507 RepID=A0A411PF09_9GAMM|nr:response regulator [Shewanella maritima]
MMLDISNKQDLTAIERILIVEDDDFQRHLVNKQVTKLCNAEVVAAEDGEAAMLAMINGFQPDVIFCDLNMPGVDGIELLRIIATLHFTGHIVLLSAESDEILQSVKLMSKSYGFASVNSLKKPITSKDLELVLLQALQTTSHKPQQHTDSAAQGFTDVELTQAMFHNQLCLFYQPMSTQLKSRSLVQKP